MSRDWRLYLDDVREACERISRYVGEMDKAGFLADDKTYDAVLRNLEVIGEAAKKLPDDVRARYGGVDWRKIAGFRDIIAHAYFGVDQAILWDIVRNKAPAPMQQVRGTTDEKKG